MPDRKAGVGRWTVKAGPATPQSQRNKPLVPPHLLPNPDHLFADKIPTQHTGNSITKPNAVCDH